MSCPFVPTSETCDTGAASVAAMDSVFQSLPPNIQANFQSAHDSIMASFQSAYSWYDQLFGGFSSSCGTVCEIGLQADTLTGQMQIAMGQTSVQGPSQGSSNMSLQTMVILGVVAFLGISYLGNRI